MSEAGNTHPEDEGDVYALGRKRERTDILAWLRRLADEAEEAATSPHGTLRDLLGGAARAEAARSLARRIERGDHEGAAARNGQETKPP